MLTAAQTRVYFLWGDDTNSRRYWGMGYREHIFMRLILYLRYVSQISSHADAHN